MTPFCSSSGSLKANMLCPGPGPGPGLTVSSQQCTIRLQTAHSCTTCMRSSINMKRVIGSVACLSSAGSAPFLMLPLVMLLLRLFRRQARSSCNTQAPNADISASIQCSRLVKGFEEAFVLPAHDDIAYQTLNFQTYMLFTRSVSLQARTAMLHYLAAVSRREVPRESLSSSYFGRWRGERRASDSSSLLEP